MCTIKFSEKNEFLLENLRISFHVEYLSCDSSKKEKKRKTI